MPDGDTVRLIDQWKAGDQDAATALFRRYAQRLMNLARVRLSEKLARRIDPEDVVQSAYRSFFREASSDDRYILERSGDLWGLLVGITLRKLYRQVERNTAGKRSIDREEVAVDQWCRVNAELLAKDPSPEEITAAADELGFIMAALSPRERLMLERRLQGHTIDQIAVEIECSERTVRRFFDKLKQTLLDRENDLD